MKNVILCLAALSLFFSCSDRQKASAPSAVKVVTQTVSRNSFDNSNSYVGTVDAGASSVLSFETGGKITRLLCREGDRVAKGQLLGTVSPTTLRDSHYATQVTLQQAQDAYKRMKKLHDEGVIPEIKWVEIETKLRQAEAAERIAREQLSHTELYAPFAGVVTSRSAEVGMNVLPDQPVYKIADVSAVDVNFSVPEKEINNIRVGEKAQVTVDAAGARVFDAVVKEKGIVADEVSHTYNVRLSLSGASYVLLPGMACSVRLSSQTTDSAFVVPMGAVELDTDNVRFVWLSCNGKAVRRNVEVGDFSGGGVEIISGLNEGDKVIVSGMQKVSEGMRVTEGR